MDTPAAAYVIGASVSIGAAPLPLAEARISSRIFARPAHSASPSSACTRALRLSAVSSRFTPHLAQETTQAEPSGIGCPRGKLAWCPRGKQAWFYSADIAPLLRDDLAAVDRLTHIVDGAPGLLRAGGEHGAVDLCVRGGG